nr:transporter [Pyrinomonadaceae bacterium]
QFSFTLPIQKVNGPIISQRGIGDFALNYRYQLINRERVAFAPRFSLLLPTGD